MPPDGTIGCVAIIIPPAGGAGTRYVNGQGWPVIPCHAATRGGDHSCDESERKPEMTTRHDIAVMPRCATPVAGAVSRERLARRPIRRRRAGSAGYLGSAPVSD
uniref:Uncharacterized protein n=1 Tax=Burkholderia orbicola (strain AU 1054) TaxID=331271 RepID=A0A0H2XLS3_BURO1